MNYSRAFTFIELLVVIVLLGILSAVLAPQLSRDELNEAQQQVIQHLQLTQNQALTHHTYIGSSDSSIETNINATRKAATLWFKGYWQMQFNTGTTELPYSVYSDTPSNSLLPQYSDKADKGDYYLYDSFTRLFIARDGTDIPEYILKYRDTGVDLADTYGVTNVSVVCPSMAATNASTRSRAHILFDDIGRPYCSSGAEDSGGVGVRNSFDFMAIDTIRVTLRKNSQSAVVCIEPQTGYIHGCS